MKHHHRLRHHRRHRSFDKPAEEAKDAEAKAEAAKEAAMEAPKAEERGQAKAMDDSPYHPLVDRVLDTMDSDLTNLKEKRSDMDSAREEMSESKARALAHMNDAVAIQREEVRAESLARGQEKVLKKLEEEQGKLQATHDSLYAKLDQIMTPKINKAQTRLEKEQKAVQASAAEQATWDEKAKKYRTIALEALQKKKEALKQLKEADKQLAEARKKRETAEQNYRRAKMGVNGKVEAFRFADTELRASISRKSDREAAAKDASSAIDELQGIFDAEVKRIDEALEVGKQRFDMRIKRTEGVVAEAEHAGEALRQRFSQWQEGQRARADEAAEMEEKYKAGLNDYVSKRTAIFNNAQSQAAMKAESISDWSWDDWAWAHAPTDADEMGQQPVEIDTSGPAPAPASAAASPAPASEQ